MPNIKDQDTVDAIAKTFLTNGLVKSLALQTVGYSVNYSEHNGLKLFDNDRVKVAIAKIQAEAAEKTGFTIEQAQIEYEAARVLAMTVNQPAAAATAITGKARLYGMDKDAGGGEKTVIIISPKSPTSPKPIDSKEIDKGMAQTPNLGYAGKEIE